MTTPNETIDRHYALDAIADDSVRVVQIPGVGEVYLTAASQELTKRHRRAVRWAVREGLAGYDQPDGELLNPLEPVAVVLTEAGIDALAEWDAGDTRLLRGPWKLGAAAGQEPSESLGLQAINNDITTLYVGDDLTARDVRTLLVLLNRATVKGA